MKRQTQEINYDRYTNDKPGNMRLPVLKEFCCGFTVRTGALFVAWSGIVISILFLIPVLIHIGDLADIFTAHIVLESGEVSDEQKEEVLIVMKSLIGITVSLLILALLLSILLLVGIYKENRCCILPWLIVNGFFLALSIALGVVVLAALPFIPQLQHAVYEYYTRLRMALVLIVNLCLQCYIYLVVHSHYKNMLVTREGFAVFQKNIS